MAGDAPQALSIIWPAGAFFKCLKNAKYVLIFKVPNNSKHFLISSVCFSLNGAMIWNHSDSSELKMKNFTEAQLSNYLDKIETSTLLAYGVYQVEAGGEQLFEYIKGDRNSIMGLPIKDIINDIRNYNR